jgi:subtilase family serine protease
MKSDTKLGGRRARSGVRGEICAAVFERLECRLLLSADAGLRDVAAALMAAPQLNVIPCVTNTMPYGMTPAKVRQAYGFNQITFTSATGQKIVGDGSGQTIAIVDAYDDANMAADLKVFDAVFGLTDLDGKGQFALTTVKMSSRMTSNSGWAIETSLDVEWAHAIAPKAHILLVETASASLSDLMAAVDYAARQPGVAAVSMSWGASEFSQEASYDAHFRTPVGHVGGGVTFVAASGDDGKGGIYPAMSPNVVSVGGTQLTVSISGNYLAESAWSGSGGGISPYEVKPTYQSALKQSATRRVGPDVAYDGSPSSGFAVYDTVAYSGKTGWWQVGGTSAGAPQWAALIAIVDQGRAMAGKGGLDGLTQMLPALYNLASADFHDITSGSNGYAAGIGYDLVTGRGTPVATLVVQQLVAASATGQLAPTGTPTLVTTSFVPAKAGQKADVGSADAPADLAALGAEGGGAIRAADSGAAAASTASVGAEVAAALEPLNAPDSADAASTSDPAAPADDFAAGQTQGTPSSLYDLGIDVLANTRALNLLAA